MQRPYIFPHASSFTAGYLFTDNCPLTTDLVGFYKSPIDLRLRSLSETRNPIAPQFHCGSVPPNSGACEPIGIWWNFRKAFGKLESGFQFGFPRFGMRWEIKTFCRKYYFIHRRDVAVRMLL